MTEASEPETAPAKSRNEGSGAGDRLYQAAAWVVIVAGIVFVAAIIFFSGLRLGSSSDFHGGWQRGSGDGRNGTCPMMESGQMMGPGGMMGPGAMMGPRPPTQTPPPAPQPTG